jgi:hypothetical protein
MTTPIPQSELDKDFADCVRGACLSLAEVSYKRVMKNPEQGMRLLHEWGRMLDCRMEVRMDMKDE